jgi:formate/nitrite transporter FocA (FNT family)
MIMKDFVRVFIGGSFLSGIFISIGAIAFLKVGGIVGACLFTFGLISIVHYQLKLYTGVSGFVSNAYDCYTLPVILLFNIIGCAVLACFAKSFMPDQIETAHNIVQSRLSQGGFNVFMLATLCGFIMTTVVKFAREGKWLPLLFGIPAFIMCGFVHSIADAFYYSFGLDWSTGFSGQVIGIYLISVLGNFFGCNLYRIIMWIK